MFNFLHNFHPNPILISFGNINIYWYGLFMVIAILSALTITLKLARKFNLSPNKIFDIGFWLIIGGIIGARIYHVFLEFGYYSKNPLDIFKVWQGGLAIHGALIVGIILLYFLTKKYKIDFWLFTAITVPGLALAQAIGRWGNYFNGELFGKATDVAWGIPIGLMNRPNRYISHEFFHPTFLYESLGNLAIFAILLFILFKIAKKKNNYKVNSEAREGVLGYKIVLISYAILYSILRFSLEFIRIDKTPEFLGLRTPQIASLIIIIICIVFIIKNHKKPKT